ncbi:MAG TPA: ATP-binding protein [Opitutaceae bacterium]|nr:ATP-binding protein [Opitutaceae bacterium]
MRLLVVTSGAGWVEGLRAMFPAPDNVIACEIRHIVQNPALAAAADACFVAEATLSPWAVETLKQLSAVSETPLFVLTDAVRSQWEEAALFSGAQQIFRRPLRAGVIQLAVSRCQRVRSSEPSGSGPSTIGPGGNHDHADDGNALVMWRDFSRLLGQAVAGARPFEPYLEKLREVLRCGRVILYGVDPSGTEFACAAAIGATIRDFEAFRLSARSGVGQLLAERAAVVWRHRLRSDLGRESAALRELMVFGAEVAVPVTGREGSVGILLLGPRISGSDYSEQEITLLYHAVEGLAPLLARHAASTGDVRVQEAGVALLHAMPMAAAVIVAPSRITDANAPFRALLGRTDMAPVAFGDLPPAWSGAISAAVQNGAASARVELDHRMVGAPRRLRLGVQRLAGTGQSGDSFLVTVEDAQAAANAAHDSDAHGIQGLLQRVGEQLSNEFRNAITPVDIMVQLARDAGTSRLELERLSGQVGTAIHRLRRRIDDLAYLTKSAIIPESTSVSAVLRNTRERLDDWLEAKHLKRVVWLNEFSETTLIVDHRALALALAELVINGIEATDGQPVTVTAEEADEVVSFRVRNSGVWAPPPESSGFRHRPFVSSKSTGVGLGVEVASRVAENHGGKLLLGPISSDTVEAIMRVPRSLPVPRVETRVTQAL